MISALHTTPEGHTVMQVQRGRGKPGSRRGSPTHVSQGVTGRDKQNMLNPGHIRRLDDAGFPLSPSLSGLEMGSRILAPNSQGGSVGKY